MNRLKIVELDKSRRHCPLYRSTDFSAFPSSERQAIEREGERGGGVKKYRSPTYLRFVPDSYPLWFAGNEPISRKEIRKSNAKQREERGEGAGKSYRSAWWLFVRSIGPARKSRFSRRGNFDYRALLAPTSKLTPADIRRFPLEIIVSRATYFRWTVGSLLVWHAFAIFSVG